MNRTSLEEERSQFRPKSKFELAIEFVMRKIRNEFFDCEGRSVEDEEQGLILDKECRALWFGEANMLYSICLHKVVVFLVDRLV